MAPNVFGLVVVPYMSLKTSVAAEFFRLTDTGNRTVPNFYWILTAEARALD